MSIELDRTSAYTLVTRRYSTIPEDSLTLPNKIELISGIATGILAVCVPLVLRLSYSDLLAFILIALVVAGGSYLHVVHRNIAGFVIVLIAGGIISFIGIVGAAIVAVYSVESWTVLLVYLPGWTAFAAVLASIVTQLRRRETRHTDERG